MMRFLLPIFVAGYFLQCTPPPTGPSKAAQVNLDLNNPAVQRLYNLRDERRTDSLLHYLQHEEATLRYLAALSFASSGDSSAIDALANRLRDTVEDVRIAAAFALGQIGLPRCEKPLVDAFARDDTASVRQRFNAVVLEAVGKCGSTTSLRHIATVTTYMPTDTLLLEGQCRAIYRFGLRDSVLPVATQLMVNYLQNDKIPAPARLMAAHYLARTKNISFDSAQVELISVSYVRAHAHPDIRVAIVKALEKSPTWSAFNRLANAIETENDWRVKCEIIQALGKFDYDTTRTLVAPFLSDTNPHISRTAAEFFVQYGQAQDGDYYWRITQDEPDLPLMTQILLYHASLKHLSGKPQSKEYVNDRLQQFFRQATSPYERAACLRALSEYGWNYVFIHDRGFNDPHPAVKTAAAAALVSILKKPNFYTFFGENSGGVRRALYRYLREIVAAGDPGMIAEGADGFRVPAMNFLNYRDSARLDDLREALVKLRMPRDYEAYLKLDSALAFFEERPASALPKIAYNHPIGWEALKQVSPKTEVTLETEEGKITLELFPLWAPGSVANFLQLASDGFFDGKNFHRVVSNHVIQGGCPRGDGYGGLDYTIRTEIGLVWYDSEGYLGMASAGRDTEGTQFFITHTARPHLDGRYTIFGKVKSGMDVVNRIMPGGVIKDVTVQY
ncbi:MAG: peptidylprolyl isomerase [Saprospiraceae bacterium]|nr:peptidylprolyl isomerase [Saprospiraceae bacterium]